jgi:hypothetical protein
MPMWQWFYNTPSAIWQWIGIGIAILALGVAIMALLPVFRMIRGKPKIYIVFEVYYDKSRQENFLICQIGNPPIKNRFDLCLGVYRRTADGVYISFSIQDTKTNKMIATDIETSDSAISIPPSSYPEYTFDVVFAKDDFTKCFDHLNGQNFDLPIGEYIAIVNIDTPEEEITHKRRFIVGNKKEDLRWEA